MNDHLLRDSLADIGAQAEPVDLLHRSLSRSRQIRRRHHTVAGALAVLALASGGAVTVELGQPQPQRPPAAAATEGSIAGLPGWLYYVANNRLFRLTRTGPRPLITAVEDQVAVAPDGSRIAYVDSRQRLLVTDGDGTHQRTVAAATLKIFQVTWAPDGRSLFTVREDDRTQTSPFGIVDADTGVYTPLSMPDAHQDPGTYPKVSADGRHLVYDNGDGTVGVADAEDQNRRVIPVLGDTDVKVNPGLRRAAGLYSVSADASLIAIDQHTGDTLDNEPTFTANTVIDTRTGAPVPLPVSGAVNAILFQPDGGILVRSRRADGATHLTLLAADRHPIADVVEPAALGGYHLLAYTPH